MQRINTVLLIYSEIPRDCHAGSQILIFLYTCVSLSLHTCQQIWKEGSLYAQMGHSGFLSLDMVWMEVMSSHSFLFEDDYWRSDAHTTIAYLSFNKYWKSSRFASKWTLCWIGQERIVFQAFAHIFASLFCKREASTGKKYYLTTSSSIPFQV